MSEKIENAIIIKSEDIRPADKILNFIDQLETQGEGSRLPSIRQIARQLNVSAPTVQSVFRKLAKEGRIRTEVGNGSFLASGNARKSSVKIALNFSLNNNPQMEDWMMYISMGILRAASATGKDISLAPIQEEDINDKRAVENIIERRKDVDGLILFPCDHAEMIRDAYRTANTPVVDVTQPSGNSTSNFVSPDYYYASFVLGQTLRNAGRKNALLLLTQSSSESMPMRSIHAGFVNGFGVGARDLKFEVIEGVGHYEELGKRAVEERLKRKKNIPDIIFSSNDYLALGAVAACQEAGLNIPEDAGIIGGTGLGLVNAGFHGLTRMAQPMERIGAELLNMLCRRIDNKGEDLPGIFLPIAFTGEATVRKEELEELTRVSYCNSEAQKGSGK